MSTNTIQPFQRGAVIHTWKTAAFLVSSLLVVAGASQANGAVISLVSEFAKIASSPPNTVSASNQTTLSPQGINLTAAGDEAASGGSLLGLIGQITLAAHGCSGPPVGGLVPAGSAQGTTVVEYSEDWVIQSATLPINTPISIRVRAAFASQFLSVIVPAFQLGVADSARVAGSAGLSFNNGSVVHTGSFESVGGSPFQPPSINKTGVFANPSDDFTTTIVSAVGRPFNILVRTTVTATATAGNPDVTEADGQIAIMWGAEVLGGLAEIRKPETGEPFPSFGDATADGAHHILPPRPHTVPEPSTVSLVLLGCSLATAMRSSGHRRFNSLHNRRRGQE